MKNSNIADAAWSHQTVLLRCRRRASQAATLMGVLLVAATSVAGAATYYVASNGNDSAAGNLAAPWRTIQRAANGVNPGDTVLVNTGVYREKVSFTRSGAPGQNIVFKNAAGQFPVIDGAGVSMGQWDALVGFSSVGYVELDGFEIRNSSAYNVWVGGEAHHLTLQRLNIHSGPSSGIWLDGPKSRPAMSVISGNNIHNNAQGGVTVWAASGGYYRIEGNEVWGNLGQGNYDGIQVGGYDGGSHHVVVKNNVVHDNGSSNVGEDPIDLGGHGINHHYLVEGNRMYGGTGSFKLKSGAAKRGEYIAGISSFHIARFNELTGIAFVNYDFPDPIVIYNNTFFNCGQCVMFYVEDSSDSATSGDSTYRGGDTGRMNFKNNVFFQEAASDAYALLTAGAGGGFGIDLTYRSVRFQNNMYKFSGGQAIQWGETSVGPGITDLLFSGFKQSNAPDYPETGSILTTVAGSQMFANEGARDYHLVANSPAVGRGTPLTKALNAGINSTTLIVDRASYFHDGYCVSGECLNTPDSIVIGNSSPVRIVAINDLTNTITLASAATWEIDAAVSLPYSGAGPDIGAHEFSSESRLAAPTNMRVIKIQ